jgi:hypothetical protein
MLYCFEYRLSLIQGSDSISIAPSEDGPQLIFGFLGEVRSDRPSGIDGCVKAQHDFWFSSPEKAMDW